MDVEGYKEHSFYSNYFVLKVWFHQKPEAWHTRYFDKSTTNKKRKKNSNDGYFYVYKHILVLKEMKKQIMLQMKLKKVITWI